LPPPTPFPTKRPFSTRRPTPYPTKRPFVAPTTTTTTSSIIATSPPPSFGGVGGAAEGGDEQDQENDNDDDDDDDERNCFSIVEVVCMDPQRRTTVFCDLIREFGLEERHFLPSSSSSGNGNGNGTTTVFAPIDGAFAELPWLQREETNHNHDGGGVDGAAGGARSAALEYILLYHVVVADRAYAFDDLECKALIETRNGESSRTRCGDRDRIKYQKGAGNDGDTGGDNAATTTTTTFPRIVDADRLACGGNVVHLVDRVLLPSPHKIPSATEPFGG